MVPSEFSTPCISFHLSLVRFSFDFRSTRIMATDAQLCCRPSQALACVAAAAAVVVANRKKAHFECVAVAELTRTAYTYTTRQKCWHHIVWDEIEHRNSRISETVSPFPPSALRLAPAPSAHCLASAQYRVRSRVADAYIKAFLCVVRAHTHSKLMRSQKS